MSNKRKTRMTRAADGAATAGGTQIRTGAATTAGLEQGDPRKWLILTAVSLGMFMALLDATIVNIAIPKIRLDLGASLPAVSWVINAYNLAMVALFLSMGRVADKYGQKRIFVGGVAVFTLFSLACGLAPNIGWLIVFRVGQGVGGAAMAPISLSILMGAFPRHEHGRAVGLWGALGTAAAAVGPTVGGLLVTKFHWSWIFFINVPIGIIALAFALWIVPERRRAEGATGVDVAGMLLATGGLFCLTLALVQGNGWGWTSWRILVLFAIALATYPVFYWWESRHHDPMFDFRLLRIRSFTAANSGQLAFGTSMGAAMLLLVFFMVSVLGYTELRAGIVLTAMPLVALMVAPNVGRLVDRIGPRYPAAFGALCFGIGLLLLSAVGADAHWYDLAWRLAILGLGLGSAMPTLAAASMSSLPAKSGGVGSGALATLRQMGFVIGVAMLVSIFSHTIATQVRAATTEAITYVATQAQIPPRQKAEIIATLKANAAAGKGGGNSTSSFRNFELPPPPAGTSAALAAQERAQQAQIQAKIGTFFTSKVVRAFDWPFYAAALAAFLAVIPGLLTGRRLGEHEGDEKRGRTRKKPAAEAGG